MGLRINQVPFKEAETWLHDHDETPDRKEFPKRFDRLYGTRGTSWSDVTSTSEPFRCALDLWHDYSKVIRNHLAHAIRSYVVLLAGAGAFFAVAMMNLSSSMV